jgi:Tfp pilus assembly protein PilF
MNFKLLVPLAIALAAAGCRRSTDLPEEKRKNAQQAYQEGVAAFESRDFTTARDKLNEAISSGAVYSGSIVDAKVRFAVATAATGDIGAATAQLDELEKNAPDLDLVYAARSYVLAKQGKLAESRAALAKARQYNRTVQEFKD